MSDPRTGHRTAGPGPWRAPGSGADPPGSGADPQGSGPDQGRRPPGAGVKEPRGPGLGTLVIDDLRRGGLGRVIRRDLGHLYDFYLDEERRERLGRMNRLRRWLMLGWWLLEALITRLPPARRAMLLVALLLSVAGQARFTVSDGTEVSFNFAPAGFVIVLLVLMLELKDRLLAHDELSIGRQVQMALLPKSEPVVPGWSIWIYTRPANHVGGDLVDFLPLRAGAAGLALGDVAGKGLGAALLMAKLQSTLRALAPDCENLGEVGARVNRILCRDGLPNRFATLVYCELEPGSECVRVLNAGHLPVVVLREGAVESLPAPAPPLGIAADVRFEEQRIALGAGDTLIVHSDGLSEARNASGEFFGEKLLSSLWPALRGVPAAAAGRRLLDEAERFAGQETLDDDLSLVVVQRS